MQTVSERIKPQKDNVVRENPDRDTHLDTVAKWQEQSASLKSTYEDRWTRNMKLVFGIPVEDEGATSKVRNRKKMYFRKIWTIVWRLIASVYSSLLADPDNVKIEGADKLNDWHRAEVLQELYSYYRRRMERRNNLFLKHIWALQDIFWLGWCAGKLIWEYNEESGKDEPVYVLYPPEQVYPDLSAESPDEMKFIIFENYMDKSELEAMEYENIEKANPEGVPSSDLRAVRHNNHKDPQVFSENEYPAPGSIQGDGREGKVDKKYRVWENFYIEKGKVMYSVTNAGNVLLQKPKDTQLDIIPAILGQCLTVAHRLIGEGFPEPLEGPQESYNYNINTRKDNVALCLNAPTLVSRYVNADLGALVNVRPGGIVMADDISGVAKMQMGDVTQSSYAEAAADDGMMQEMSGVTAELSGMGKAEKATTSQINYMEGNEKINVFLAMIANTYWKDFNSKLIYMISKLATDETAIRIANESFKNKENDPGAFMLPSVDDFEFDADTVVNIGPTSAGKDMLIRNTMLAMDRSVMYNQQLAAIVQSGVMKAEDAKFVNVSALMEDLMPLIGKKSTTKYWIQAQPPPPVPPEGMGGNGAVEGRNQPQIGDTNIASTPEASGNDLKVSGLPNL